MSSWPEMIELFFFEAEVKKISRIWERELSNAREKERVGRNKGSEEGGK